MQQQRKSKGLRLLLVIHFYKYYMLYITSVKDIHFISYGETEYSFLNYLMKSLDNFFLNNQNGGYITTFPRVIITSYFRLNPVNYWKYNTIHDLQMFYHKKEKNISKYVKVNYKIKNGFIKFLKTENLLSNKLYTNDIYIGMNTPFMVSIYFDNPIRTKKLWLIDLHRCHLHLCESIDLDSYYFDKPTNQRPYYEVYDSGLFVSYKVHGIKYVVVLISSYFIYLLSLVKIFDISFFFGLISWASVFGYFVLWGFLGFGYQKGLLGDTERHLNFIYYGDYFRNLHGSSIGRLELEFGYHDRTYTTHITGKNGLERFLGTYGSCYLWAKDCDLGKIKKVRDHSDEESTQLHVDNILEDFGFQNEIKLYLDKYAFASYYFNFGKDIEFLSRRRGAYGNYPNRVYNNLFNREDLNGDKGWFDFDLDKDWEPDLDLIEK